MQQASASACATLASISKILKQRKEIARGEAGKEQPAAPSPRSAALALTFLLQSYKTYDCIPAAMATLPVVRGGLEPWQEMQPRLTLP
jgi:hypothetical protein